MDLKGRNFLTLKDFSPEEITGLLDLAADLKAKKTALPLPLRLLKSAALYTGLFSVFVLARGMVTLGAGRAIGENPLILLVALAAALIAPSFSANKVFEWISINRVLVVGDVAVVAAFAALATLIEGGRFDARLVDAGLRHVYRFHTPGGKGLTIAGWDAGCWTGEALRIRSDAKAAWAVDLMGNRTELKPADGAWTWTISREPAAIVLDGATCATIDTGKNVK